MSSVYRQSFLNKKRTNIKIRDLNINIQSPLKCSTMEFLKINVPNLNSLITVQTIYHLAIMLLFL